MQHCASTVPTTSRRLQRRLRPRAGQRDTNDSQLAKTATPLMFLRCHAGRAISVSPCRPCKLLNKELYKAVREKCTATALV